MLDVRDLDAFYGDSHILFNLRLGVESLDARWSLIGNVDNLFNHPWLAQYAIGGFAQAAPPRTWRITAKYSF